MYCPHCREEIDTGCMYCSACGKPTAGFNSNIPPIQKPAHSSKRKLPFIICFFLAMGSVISILMLLFIFKSNTKNVKLKYEWGTHYSTIKDNEIIIGEYTSYYPTVGKSELRLHCEDIYHEVDGIEELMNNENVFYWTDFDKKLYRISYDIDSDLSLTEKLDILKEHYGDNIYIVDYNRTDARYFHYYWLIDDTVIELYNKNLDYYDLEYFSQHSDHQPIIEHFNITE